MAENDLNEVFEETIDDAAVITVPIDTTLRNSGEAADAKAVGDALALKADASQVTAINVNGQGPDLQGRIIVSGTDIQVSETDETTLTDAIAAVDGKTGADIPVSGAAGAQSISEAIASSLALTADRMPVAEGSATMVADELARLDSKKGTVKSVNSRTPDGNGNVQVDEVGYARNLTSETAKVVVGTFAQRMSAGGASITDGTAYIQQIRGNMAHTGYVAEELRLNVQAEESGITANIDRDTFVAAVSQSGTITLTYTTAWSADPAAYGVTVNGTPASGDVITITYVKEERGTIIPATPQRLVATDWNLYRSSQGYAKVVKYDHRYHVGGTYSSLAFSATPTGNQTVITPDANGSFDIPGDGYVHVTGGNATDTYITPEWEDWTGGPAESWIPYSESTVSVASVMNAYFPYGLLAIGATYDVIDVELGQAISRIERMDYNAENLATAQASGRDWVADEHYIYIVRAAQVTNSITQAGQYAARDHGIEYWEGTDTGVTVMALYGVNLKNKLERDVVTISAQELTTEQQRQVQVNIGAEMRYFGVGESQYSGTISSLVTDVKARATGIYLYFASASIGTALAGATISVAGMVLVSKRSSGWANYFYQTETDEAVGVINLSTGAVTVKYSTAQIGIKNTASTIADKSVANNAATELGTIDLTAGEYIITVTGSWGENATGFRSIYLSDTNAGQQLNVAARSIVQAISGTQTRQQVTVMYKASGAKTLHVVGLQSSGSTLTVSTRYAIARIK